MNEKSKTTWTEEMSDYFERESESLQAQGYAIEAADELALRATAHRFGMPELITQWQQGNTDETGQRD